MIFDESGPSICIDDLTKFEQRHRLKIPEDYRQFLLSVNGGIPYPASFKGETGVVISVHHLFSMKAKTGFHDLDSRCKSSYWEGAYEKGIIQIGYDSGNQEIMMETRPPHNGKVYLVINQTAHVMAESFSEFLEKLENRVGVERNAYDELMDRVNNGK